MARMMLHSYGMSELIRDAEVMREDAPRDHVSYDPFQVCEPADNALKSTKMRVDEDGVLRHQPDRCLFHLQCMSMSSSSYS